MSKRHWLSTLQAACLAVFVAASAHAALAETTLRVGKAMGPAFTFTPLDVGMAQGFFKSRGLAIQKFDFAGSARLQQALAAGSIDIGLGSGPEFSMVAKGLPNIGVAELAGRPALLVLIVPADSPIKSNADLKGKKIGVSTAGSLTQWLVLDLAKAQGWGSQGITTAPLGADTAMLAAMKTHQIDGMVTDLATAYRLQDAGQARIVTRFGQVVEHFIIHVIWARDALVKSDPDAVRNFLAGWFQTIAFMKANKAKTVEITAPVMNVSTEIAGKVYDELMPTFSTTGRFDREGLEVLADSFPELGIMSAKPDLSRYTTEKLLPAAAR